MNKLILSILLLSLLFLLNCGGPKETRVEGQVLDETQAPYAGVKLSAAPRDTGGLGDTLETESAADGGFVFSGLLPSVIYKLTIAGADLQIEFASPPAGKTGRLPEPLVLTRERFRRLNRRIVQDTLTGLEWQSGASSTFAEARAWAAGLEGGPWRLPSREELLSLYQPGQGEFNIDPMVFPRALARVWTGEETERQGQPAAWVIDFRTGKAQKSLKGELKRRAFAVKGSLKKK